VPVKGAVRRPEVEAQIQRFVTDETGNGSPVEFWHHVSLPRGDEQYICDETLVYAIRHFDRAHNRASAQRLGHVLYRRTAPLCAAQARREVHDQPRQFYEDVVAEATTLLWAQILDASNHFLEMQFGVVRARRTTDAVRLLRGRDGTKEFERLPASSRDDDSAVDAPLADPAEDPIAIATSNMDWHRCLATIPDTKVRRALFLRVELNLPVEDAEHPDRSISWIMHVGPRMVRHYFQQAKPYIVSYYKEND